MRFTLAPRPGVCASISRPEAASVVLPPEIRPLAAFGFAGGGALLLGAEAALFIAADAAMGMQPFEDEFGRPCPHRVRLIRAQTQGGGLFHQPLNARKLLYHAARFSSAPKPRSSLRLM